MQSSFLFTRGRSSTRGLPSTSGPQGVGKGFGNGAVKSVGKCAEKSAEKSQCQAASDRRALQVNPCHSFGLVMGIMALASGLSGCSWLEKEKPPIKGKQEVVSPIDQVSVSSQKLTRAALGSGHQVGGFSAPLLRSQILLPDSAPIVTGICPAVYGETAYLSTGQGEVVAVGSSGAVAWRTRLLPDDSPLAELGCPLAVDAMRVYVATPDLRLVAIDRVGGKVLWTLELPMPVRGAPAVQGGQVAVLTVKNHVLAVDGQKGRILWTYQGSTEEASLGCGSSPVMVGQRLIAATSGGEVVSLDRAQGTLEWTDIAVPSGGPSQGQGFAHIAALPVVQNERVYTLSYNGQLACFHIESGKRLWEAALGGVQTPVLVGRALMVLTGGGRLVALDSQSGKMYWAKDLPAEGQWASLLADAGGRLLVLDRKEGQLLAMDAVTGRQLWSQALKGKAWNAVAAWGGVLVTTQNGGLLFLRP
jgi:outer membrane protein assembly factor BamB